MQLARTAGEAAWSARRHPSTSAPAARPPGPFAPSPSGGSGGPRPAGSAAGFSMIEVLITVFVLSIGILGIGGLQLVAKQSNFEAIQRTTAIMLTHDIVERMRANPRALEDYVSGTGATTLGGGTRGTTAPTPNCSVTPCDHAQLAEFDLWEWERAIDGATETSGTMDVGGLENPTACITGPADGAAGVYAVTLAWRGKHELSDTTKSGNTCGAGNYGDDDRFRRLLTIQAFMING
jgi:type IV pilus assembly protein PilV